MSALLDDHGALTTIFIPAAVQAAVMTIELGTGSGGSHGRGSDRRQRGR